MRANRHGTTLRLSVAGELDRAGSGRVERAFEEALEAPTERVVVDLAAVTFLDLGAIKTLLKVHARARRYKLDLTVVRPRGTARRIFTLTPIGEALPATDGDVSAGSAPARAAMTRGLGA